MAMFCHKARISFIPSVDHAKEVLAMRCYSKKLLSKHNGRWSKIPVPNAAWEYLHQWIKPPRKVRPSGDSSSTLGRRKSLDFNETDMQPVLATVATTLVFCSEFLCDLLL